MVIEKGSPDVEAVMLAARVHVAVSAQSMSEVDDLVSVPQLRVLVMMASRGPLNLGAVAEGVGVHPSNATRTVDRLLSGGLPDRRDDPTDLRNLVLELTAVGLQLVDRVLNHRREAIAEILQQMPASHRRALVPVLRAFAEAGRVIFEQRGLVAGSIRQGGRRRHRSTFRAPAFRPARRRALARAPARGAAGSAGPATSRAR